MRILHTLSSRQRLPRATLFGPSLPRLAALCAAACCCAIGNAMSGVPLVLSSPDERARLEIASGSSGLTYGVTWQGRMLVQASDLNFARVEGLRVGATRRREIDRTWKPVWGDYSRIREHYRELAIDLVDAAGRGHATLVCRLFDDGLGLRFEFPGQAARQSEELLPYSCDFRLPKGASFWHANGEEEPVGPAPLSALGKGKSGARLPFPLVARIQPDLFVAVLESDLFSAEGFTTMQVEAVAEKGLLRTTTAARHAATVGITPWRVLTFGRDAAALLQSRVALNLAAECRLADTSWIKPGKVMWDWRVHGYKTGDFVYGIDTASYRRFIDFAAGNNIQYLLLDGGWYARVAEDRLEPAPSVDLPALRRHAREKGVELVLYYDRKNGVLPDDRLFPHLAALGARGVKYGFMGDDPAFTRASLKQAAEHRLLIDYHDHPSPMVGASRTMPNAITREYCHAQQDARRAFSPTSFLKMAQINALTGPLDQTNGSFGLDGINAGQRKKGPLKPQTYNVTVAGEAARVLLVSSGWIVLPDAPEEYAKKADLFEFIARMPPATWDDTRILRSELGRLLVTARRSGEAWFVGAASNEDGASLELPLDFLSPGIDYIATRYEDAPDSHYVRKREAYRVRTENVRAGQAAHLTLAPGGGCGLWIRPKT